MTLAVDLPVELLESLHAAAADGANIHAAHNLLCSALDRDDPDWCDCGIPKLLRGLAELLPLPPGAQQPYRPAWVPSTAVAA